MIWFLVHFPPPESVGYTIKLLKKTFHKPQAFPPQEGGRKARPVRSKTAGFLEPYLAPVPG